MSKRHYEVDVLWCHGTPVNPFAGWTWEILVGGEVIARGNGLRLDSVMDAFHAAKGWAYKHTAMGYELRKEWWKKLV